jgi:Eukaryotic aspartyl protease
MPIIARIPITNFYANGDYTAQIAVGSEGTIVNVILDTGSSTLAVKALKYNPIKDRALKSTSYAQDVRYGTGGWAGPLVTSRVSFGVDDEVVSLDEAYLAITDASLPDNFGNADGILGIAYKGLNRAYNLATYFQQQQVQPPVTYPWPFSVASSSTGLNQLMSLFQTLQFEDIPPYIEQLKQHGGIANKFAFYTLRSYPSVASENPETDPINQGIFVLGGGEEQADLYAGPFLNVAVLDDLYYNVNLKAIQVGSTAIKAVAPLPVRLRQTAITNAIVDSGTNSLALATDVWKSVLAGFEAIDPGFVTLIQQAAATGIGNASIQLAKWPDVDLLLSGSNGEDVRLRVAPQTYWQFDAISPGQAVFAMQNGSLPQSILGLPLMNNYYTVFDRSQDAYGIIRFAAIKTR